MATTQQRQETLYKHLLSSYRKSGGTWSAVEEELVCHFWTSNQPVPVMIGESMAVTGVNRPTQVNCAADADIEAGDLVHADNAGQRTGKWYDVVSEPAYADSRANKQTIQLERRTARPQGWSGAWP